MRQSEKGLQGEEEKEGSWKEGTERGTLNSATRAKPPVVAQWSKVSLRPCYAPSVGLKYVQRPSAHSSARSVVNLKAPRVDLSSPISVSVERTEAALTHLLCSLMHVNYVPVQPKVV